MHIYLQLQTILTSQRISPTAVRRAPLSSWRYSPSASRLPRQDLPRHSPFTNLCRLGGRLWSFRLAVRSRRSWPLCGQEPDNLSRLVLPDLVFVGVSWLGRDVIGQLLELALEDLLLDVGSLQP